MYDEKMKNSCNFAPKEAIECSPSSDENDNQMCSSPSKIFKRHSSLAELTSVAVSEKEALDQSSQNNETSELSQDFESEESDCKYSNDSRNSSVIPIQLWHVGGTHIAQMTPTKLGQGEELQGNDPLTPTTNLKMLMSVVSPAIRDREEKKKDLFYTDDDCEKVVVEVAEEVIIEKPTVYSRKDKSLGLLCQRFLAKFPENPGDNPIEICLDEVSKDLKVERRRVYDIVNVLESVEVLSRMAKNRYLWHGKTRIAHTLGKLKALSKSQERETSRNAKDEAGHPKICQSKMKRHFSSGDVPKQIKTLAKDSCASPTLNNELHKHKERLRIKAAIDSTDRCRKDKSLGVLSQKFLMMFLLSKSGVVTLEDAANVLLDEQDNVKYKTKVRRLYDIANILSSLKLIEKVHIRGISGKKPGFKWIGVAINNLPEDTMLTSPTQTSKTKHSLLPDSASFSVNTKSSTLSSRKHPTILPLLKPANTPPSSFSNNSIDKNSVGPNVRWTKTMSCHASIAGCPRAIKQEKQPSFEAGAPDGFLVHEFASSPANFTGRDMLLYSPTEITFREEIMKLQEKFPNRMSQLLAVLPFNSKCQTPSNKSSRRNLFNFSEANPQTSLAQVNEPNSKRVRTNSVGDFKTAGGNSCAQVNTSGERDSSTSSNENVDPENIDNQSKFMHSTDSPFKVMSSSACRQTSDPPFNVVPGNTNMEHVFNYNKQVLEERQKQHTLLQEQRDVYQTVESQWHQHMLGQFKNLGAGSRMVQLVDQAVSPIPPSKLQVAQASIAIQASLIKDISPLKPLVFLQPVHSPWKPPAVSPISIPPVPPSTPELPNELAVGPFQSQANKMHSLSFPPKSQSCSSSPVGPFTSAGLFFPPSPTTPISSFNSLVLSQPGAVLYTFNQIPPATSSNVTSPETDHHSNSCPASVNPSPTPIEPVVVLVPGLQNMSAGITTPTSLPQTTPDQMYNRSCMVTPTLQPGTLTTCQYKQQPTGYSTMLNPCMMATEAGDLDETPSSCVAETLLNNASRRLRLTNEKS